MSDLILYFYFSIFVVLEMGPRTWCSLDDYLASRHYMKLLILLGLGTCLNFDPERTLYRVCYDLLVHCMFPKFQNIFSY